MSKVPEGWENKYLRDILSDGIKNGYSPNPAESETGYWVLGLGSLSDNGFNISGIKPVHPTDKVLSSTLSVDDFLISRSNTPDKVGRSVRFRGEVVNCSYPDLMMRFRVNSELANIDYIEHVLKSSPVRRYFKDSAAGSSGSMVKINKLTVEKTPLSLPCLEEQQKIAKILSTWDKAISVTEQLISNSQQQKKALMHGLLTGAMSLGDSIWSTYKLGDIATITMGSSPKSSAYNQKKIGLPLLQGNADIKNRKSTPRIYTSEITKECLENDILVSVRAPVGAVALSMHQACIGRGISSIRAKKEVLQKYLYQWLLWYEPQWGSLAQGSTFESVNSTDIQNLSLEIPVLSSQQKIAEVLTAADREIELLQQKLAGFKQEKQALMQQLLTGKRRVAL